MRPKKTFRNSKSERRPGPKNLSKQTKVQALWVQKLKGKEKTTNSGPKNVSKQLKESANI
jgi:hypothetical protein